MTAMDPAWQAYADPTEHGRQRMCRWLAYTGEPLQPSTLILDAKHSVVAMSLNSPLGAEPVNGDGFGFGWYPADAGAGATPSTFRSHRARVERREPPRDQPRGPQPALLHARSSRGRPADPADELPSVPLRELAVHAQRGDLAVRPHQARSDLRRRSRRSIRTSAAPPTPRCCSTSPSRSVSPMIRSRRWATRSAWSNRRATRRACSSRCRERSL